MRDAINDASEEATAVILSRSTMSPHGELDHLISPADHLRSIEELPRLAPLDIGEVLDVDEAIAPDLATRVTKTARALER